MKTRKLSSGFNKTKNCIDKVKTKKKKKLLGCKKNVKIS